MIYVLPLQPGTTARTLLRANTQHWVSATCSAPAKLALTQQKAGGWPGTGTGCTQTAQFSSLFIFSVTPGMCLHMVEKMQRGGRSSQEHHPPCWRSPLGLVAYASTGSQRSWRRPWCLEQVKHWKIRWIFGVILYLTKKEKCIICTNSVNIGLRWEVKSILIRKLASNEYKVFHKLSNLSFPPFFH